MKKIIVLGILTLMLAPLSAQKHYERKYENSNQLSVQGTLNNAGRRTGSWTWWYPNGKISQEGSYDNGAKTGTWTLYYEDGSRLAE